MSTLGWVVTIIIYVLAWALCLGSLALGIHLALGLKWISLVFLLPFIFFGYIAFLMTLQFKDIN